VPERYSSSVTWFRRRGAIPPGRSEVGRQAGVAILLDDQDVSRRHAVLDRTGGRGRSPGAAVGA